LFGGFGLPVEMIEDGVLRRSGLLVGEVNIGSEIGQVAAKFCFVKQAALAGLNVQLDIAGDFAVETGDGLIHLGRRGRMLFGGFLEFAARGDGFIEFLVEGIESGMDFQLEGETS